VAASITGAPDLVFTDIVHLTNDYIIIITQVR